MRSAPAMVLAVSAATFGCGRSGESVDDRPFPIAREPLSVPRIAPRTPVRPLEPALGMPPVAPSPSPNLAAAPNLPFDARVLVITADGTDAAFGAITSALDYLGTPRDVLNATSGPALTAAMLADGDHGKYQAVFLDLGDLAPHGISAFTTDEWNTLAACEARFGVRQVSLYTSPTAAYGLGGAGSIDPQMNPIQTTCSAAGTAALTGVNCAQPVVIDQGWAYPAQVVDGQTAALLTDGAGNVYAAIHYTSDGREVLALTFAQASYQLITLQLGYGLVSWATRGLFIGERHVYLSPQIDDLFLATTIYPETGDTYRINGTDIQALAAWLVTRRANPLVAGLRLAWAANMMGARDGDSLTAAAVSLNSTFAWISHTWDHADLTNMNYPNAYTEFSQNDQALRARGLQPYATANLVTPGITGLGNPNAMQAAYDVGVRQVVSDTSIAAEDNPTPNAGIRNALVPGILEIPRIPTDLDYDVSQPAEWIAAWSGRRGKTGTYSDFLALESRVLTGYMLQGNNDSLMFHQADTRDFGSGHSLLADLLDATINRYLSMATWPIVSPTMDDLAGRVQARMTFDASGVSATIQPGAQITVQVANGARIPITGLCTPTAESYGGQQIAYLDLAAGGSTTLSLTDCNPGTTGTGGTGGTGGAGGASGTGGAGGAGMGSGGATGSGAGTGGDGGANGSGMAGTSGTGTAGTSGGAGASGSAGTTGGAGASGEAGATGTGAGASGEAGATGTGGSGTSGEAGTSGAGGATGAGGSGTGGAGGAPPAGCQCAVTGGSPGSGLGLMAIAAAAALSRGRHRRRRRPA